MIECSIYCIFPYDVRSKAKLSIAHYLAAAMLKFMMAVLRSVTPRSHGNGFSLFLFLSLSLLLFLCLSLSLFLPLYKTSIPTLNPLLLYVQPHRSSSAIHVFSLPGSSLAAIMNTCSRKPDSPVSRVCHYTIHAA